MSDRRELLTYYALCDAMGATPTPFPTREEREVTVTRARCRAERLAVLAAKEIRQLNEVRA